MVSIALYQIFGKPFMGFLGVVTIFSFLVTAIFGLSFYQRIVRFKWHSNNSGSLDFKLNIVLLPIIYPLGNIIVSMSLEGYIIKTILFN